MNIFLCFQNIVGNSKLTNLIVQFSDYLECCRWLRSVKNQGLVTLKASQILARMIRIDYSGSHLSNIRTRHSFDIFDTNIFCDKFNTDATLFPHNDVIITHKNTYKSVQSQNIIELEQSNAAQHIRSCYNSINGIFFIV